MLNIFKYKIWVESNAYVKSSYAFYSFIHVSNEWMNASSHKKIIIIIF